MRKPSPSHTTTVLPHLSVIQLQNPPRQQHADAISLEPGYKISQAPNESHIKTLLFSGILMVLYLSESTQTPRQTIPFLRVFPRQHSGNSTSFESLFQADLFSSGWEKWRLNGNSPPTPARHRNLLDLDLTEKKTQTHSASQQWANNSATSLNQQLISWVLWVNTDFKLTLVYIHTAFMS